MTGILCYSALHERGSILTHTLVFLFFLIASAVYLLYKPLHAAGIAIVCASLCMGYLSSCYHYSQEDRIPPFAREGARIDCKGRITNIEPMDHPFLKTKVTLAITAVRRAGTLQSWITSESVVQIFIPSARALDVADVIEIKDISLNVPQEKSLRRYYIRNGIEATSFIETLEYILVHHPRFSLTRTLFHIRGRIFRSIMQKSSSLTQVFLGGLFFGNKSESKKHTTECASRFQQWGVAHLFARSGLHLVLFIALWQLVLRFLCFPLFAIHACITLLGIIYFILTWPTASFMRAFLAFLLYQLSAFVKYPFNTLHVLSCITYLFLLINPALIFFLDFQLSFVITWALIWFYSIEHQHHMR